MPSFAVILPAAGQSRRFGADKLSATLDGQTVFARTLAAFTCRADVAQIVIAGERNHLLDHRGICRSPGGPTRAHTVLAALQQVDPIIEWVAIHDAARPLVSQALIDRVFAAAREHGAAAPAMPVTQTIKQASGPLPSPVEQTVPRASLWAMQTPQAMRRADLIAAYARCPIPLENVTDDVQLLELIGLPVMLVPGEEQNLKLTTPTDLLLAALLLRG